MEDFLVTLAMALVVVLWTAVLGVIALFLFLFCWLAGKGTTRSGVACWFSPSGTAQADSDDGCDDD